MTHQTPYQRSILLMVLLASLLVTCRKKVSEPEYDSPFDETSASYIPTPGLNTAPITSITALAAVTGGVFENNYGKPATAKGVCWSLVENPSLAGSCTNDGPGTTSFASTLANLLPDTLYYVRAYATNEAGTIYGGQRSFRTRDGRPVFTGFAITDVSSSGSKVSVSVDDGGLPVLARGVCHSKEPDPTTEDTCIASGSGTGTYSVNLTGLDRATTYYIRPYATNSVMTGYGAQASFVTAENDNLPTVSTGSVSGITDKAATVTGEVTGDGGAAVTARGVCFSTNQNPTLSGTCVAAGSGMGIFNATMTGLSTGTVYFARAFATNAVGTNYGSQTSFNTLSAPVVATESVSSLTSSSAIVSGNVTSDGGSAVTARGVCYSTSQNPTLLNTCIASGVGSGTFSATISGLSFATTYFARAYATNSIGVSYGTGLSFTTLAALPSVITGTVNTITLTGAMLSGQVTSDGGSPVTERGVCYSTSLNPTTSSSCLTSGTGVGSFTVNATTLTSGTTYNVRAYAKNSRGTAYGDNLQFKTNDPPKWTEVTIASSTPITSVHFSGSQTGFITAGNSIFRSTDGGNSWTAVQTVNDVEFTAIHSVDGTIVYAGGTRGTLAQTAYIYKSSNAGVTWQTVSEIWRQNEAVRVEAIMAQGNGSVVALVTQSPNFSQTYGHVYSSTNAGSSWTSVTVSGISGVYSMAKNSSWLVIGGGRKWTGSNYVNTAHRSSFFSSQSTSLQTVNFADGSQTFRAMDAKNQTFVGVANNGYVLLSSDEGSNWTIRRITGSENVNLNGIVMVSETTFLVVGDSGRLLRSTDSGISWSSPLGNPTTANITGLVYFSDTNLWITTSNGKLLRYQ